MIRRFALPLALAAFLGLDRAEACGPTVIAGPTATIATNGVNILTPGFGYSTFGTPFITPFGLTNGVFVDRFGFGGMAVNVGGFGGRFVERGRFVRRGFR